MSDVKDLTSHKLTANVQSSNPTRARSFKVKTTNLDYAQYVNTIKAYALAGMPFEHIANAGDHLGDIVERLEMDAPIQESWKTKVGEIAEDQGKIMAWQSRGEVVSVSHQLQDPSVTGLEIVVQSTEVAIQTPEQKIDVVEGIAVVTNKPDKLENNIYLNTPADLSK